MLGGLGPLPEATGTALPSTICSGVMSSSAEVRQGLSAAPHRIMKRGVGRAAAMGTVVDLDGIALMPVLLLTGAPLIASAQPMMVEIYMALVPMLLGCLLFGYGLTRVTPSAARTLTLAEPAIALLAVVLVGESYEPTSTPWRPRSSLPRSSRSRMRCSALWLPLPR